MCRFETVYVILLNIHKRLPMQRCSSHFATPEKKNEVLQSLALTLTLNHLANEALQATTMLFSLNLRQQHKYLIRCATDYNGY